MGSLFMLLPSTKLLSEELFNGSMLEIFDPKNGFIKLNLAWKNNTAYAKVKDIAAVINTNFYENLQKRKIVLYYNNNRFTLTADNNFLRINGSLFQMPYEAKEINGEIYVPVEDFIIYFNQFCGTDLAVKKQVKPQQQVKKEITGTTVVSNVSIQNKNNGILIDILLSKGLSGDEVEVEFRNDWLFIDLYKSKINSKIIASYRPEKPVKQVKVYQHKELASLAL